MNRRAFCLSVAALAFSRLPTDLDSIEWWQFVGEQLGWSEIQYIRNPHIKTVGHSAYHYFHTIAKGSIAERFALTAEWHTLHPPSDVGTMDAA